MQKTSQSTPDTEPRSFPMLSRWFDMLDEILATDIETTEK